MSSPRTLKYCETVPPLANSDHIGISLQVKVRANSHTRTHTNKVWRYCYADFDKARYMLATFDLTSFIHPSSVESSWKEWKNVFMTTIYEKLYSHSRNRNQKESSLANEEDNKKEKLLLQTCQKIQQTL